MFPMIKNGKMEGGAPLVFLETIKEKLYFMPW